MTTSLTRELNSRIAGDTITDPSPPSLEFIKTLIEDRETYFQAFHAQCELEEEYYFLRRSIPTAMEADFDDFVYPATARAIVDVATDHVDVNNVSIDIPLMLRSKARAERIKKFLLGSWLNIRGPQKRTAVKHSNLYGIYFWKPMFDVDNWPNAPLLADFGAVHRDGETILFRESEYIEAQKEFMAKRRLTFPFVLRNRNPRNMLWDDSRNGPMWSIYREETTAGDIRRKYPQWISNKPNAEPSTWTEYEDNVWYAYIADGQFIDGGPKMHGYGFIPTVIGIPGTAADWDEGPPEDRYQGILHPVHNLLDTEARLATQIEVILRTVAWRTIDFKGNKQQVDAVRDEYDLWGGKNWISPNVEVQASPMLNLPPDLISQLGMVQSMIEAATFPNVVRGMRPTGISTGFGVSVLAGQGRLRFQPHADGIARGIEQVNMAWLKLIENRLRTSVTVNARSEIHSFDQVLSPDDIKGYYENVVSLKAEAPEEREREALLAIQLRSAPGGPLISLYEAMRRAGVANPLEEQNQIAAELLLVGAREKQLQEFLERLGTNEQEQLAEAAGGNVGNRFVPGMPQLQRIGERNVQQARQASRDGRPSVFPRGQGGLDILGSLLGGAPGGAQGMPSGQTIR
jgi:hypothetical protein